MRTGLLLKGEAPTRRKRPNPEIELAATSRLVLRTGSVIAVPAARYTNI